MKMGLDMNETGISRRSLIQVSAAVWVIALAPPALRACSETAIPDGYAAWLRRRENGWEIVCASRSQNTGFTPFSVTSTPVLSPKDHLSPPVNLAKETVLKDFAGRTGLTPPKVFLDSGLVSGGGVRVPIWVWADFA